MHLPFRHASALPENLCGHILSLPCCHQVLCLALQGPLQQSRGAGQLLLCAFELCLAGLQLGASHLSSKVVSDVQDRLVPGRRITCKLTGAPELSAGAPLFILPAHQQALLPIFQGAQQLCLQRGLYQQQAGNQCCLGGQREPALQHSHA